MLRIALKAERIFFLLLLLAAFLEAVVAKWERQQRERQIDSMLPCVCSVIDHRRSREVSVLSHLCLTASVNRTDLGVYCLAQITKLRTEFSSL